MSKHQKELRRERRKVERTRRSRAVTGGAAALAAAAAIAAGTSAYANPVRYDNPPGPGHFEWFAEPASEVWLDVVLAADSQPGPAMSLSGLRQTFYAGYVGVLEGAAAGATVQRVNGFLPDIHSGQLIPAGFAWGPVGYVGYGGYSLLPEGQATYVGVRFDLGAGTQYGWVGVERAGYGLDAFAWGYETDPGVPIPAGIPEPGSLALLAMGAVGVLSRRRG